MSELSSEEISKLQRLDLSLTRIQRDAEQAQEQLKALELSLDPRVTNWKCHGCGYRKNYTKPASVVACDSCPRCQSTKFSPGVK
jgi:predicted Zn-ribbon and HTH transcriptional regulator